MVTIQPNAIKQLPIWNDCIDTFSTFRIKMTKIDNSEVKIFTPTSITPFEKWTLFLFEEVDEIDENLPLGKVNLNENPGEWIFELQIQIASIWTTVQKELSRVIQPTQPFNEYSN